MDKKPELKEENNVQELEKTEEIEDILVREQDERKESLEYPQIGKGKYIEGIGRRKTATCRVRIWDQEKDVDEYEILVNNKKYTEYFPTLELTKIVDSPLRKLKTKAYRVTVLAKGGGVRGQAEAVRLGLARALVKLNPAWRIKFKKAGYLTRDPREVERKKYGRRKARRREQWQKR